MESCQVLWKCGGVYLSACTTTRDICISLLLNGITIANFLSFGAMFIAFAISSDDVKLIVYAILQFLVSANFIGSYVPIVIVKGKIRQLTESLQRLVNESELIHLSSK